MKKPQDIHEKTLLHVGCGPFKLDGFINTDKESFDITKPWPYEDITVDGIVSMHVLECLTAKELVFALSESYRVLKPNGVMRNGVPVIDFHTPFSKLLGWSNITLFSADLLERITNQIGFSAFKGAMHKLSAFKEGIKLCEADNRPEETFYFEVIK